MDANFNIASPAAPRAVVCVGKSLVVLHINWRSSTVMEVAVVEVVAVVVSTKYTVPGSILLDNDMLSDVGEGAAPTSVAVVSYISIAENGDNDTVEKEASFVIDVIDVSPLEGSTGKIPSDSLKKSIYMFVVALILRDTTTLYTMYAGADVTSDDAYMSIPFNFSDVSDIDVAR